MPLKQYFKTSTTAFCIGNKEQGINRNKNVILNSKIKHDNYLTKYLYTHWKVKQNNSEVSITHGKKNLLFWTKFLNQHIQVEANIT